MKKYIQRVSKYKPSALQGTLHLEAARPRPSLATEHPYERRALSILSIMLAVLVAAYLYFVAASILNVMARTEAAAQAQSIESSIGAMEQQYFAISQDVSPQAGERLGLSPISQTSYVYRPGNAAVAPTQSQAI